MKAHRLLFVLAILATALFAITLISDDSSATLTDKYVGNQMVDFEWTRYSGDDFDRYELYRDDEKVDTIYDQDELFVRDDDGLFTDQDYSYELRVINETDKTTASSIRNVHTGDVRGTITIYTSWDDLRYDLVGNVIVAENATLSISQNTEVHTQTKVITVQGTLSDLYNVNFHGKGLGVDGSTSEMEDFLIDGCEFDGTEGGSNPGYALLLSNLDVSITDNTFSNYDAGMRITGDEAYIQGNLLEDFEVGVAIYVEGDDYSIMDNEINRCGKGIHVEGNDGLISNNQVSEDVSGGIYFKGNGARISNNELMDGGEYGIKCECDDLKIENNNITGNDYTGIWALSLTNSTIKDNEILNNDGWGIYIQGGENNEIRENRIDDNYQGIYALNNPNTIYFDNDLSGNPSGGISLKNSGNADISHNNIYNSYVGIYLDTCSNSEIMFNDVSFSTNGYAISVRDTTNITVQWNEISYSYGVINLQSVREAKIDGNTLEYNEQYGIYMTAVWDTEVGAHTITDITETGIFILDGHNVSVEMVEVSYATNGFYVVRGDNVTISNSSARYTTRAFATSQAMDNVTIRDNEVFNATFGLFAESQSSNLEFNNNTLTELGTGVYFGTISVNNTIENNEITDCENFGIHAERVGMNLIRKNKIDTVENDTGFGDWGSGIFLERSNNITVEDNDISNCSNSGIHLYSASAWDQHQIINNRITNTTDHGLFVFRSNHNLVQENIITQAKGYGALFIRWSDYCEVEKNEIYENEHAGLYFQGSSLGGHGNKAGNNSIRENGGSGISFEDNYECYIGENKIENNTGGGINFRAADENQNHNNTFKKNVIYSILSEDNPTDITISMSDPNATSTRFIENSMGYNHSVTISITDLAAGAERDTIYYSIRAVENPPEDPVPPEYAFKASNINNYVEINSQHDNASLNLTFHYDFEDIKIGDDRWYRQETINVWRFGEVEEARGGGPPGGDPVWRFGNEGGETPWNGSRHKDVFGYTVGVVITEFSIFAPLASMPVHNLDTGEDFAWIFEAINDDDTWWGHTISVDASYTGTEEPVVIDKSIILVSSSGDPLDTVIETYDENEPAIDIQVDDVIIRGFTIKGAVEHLGIQVQDQENVTIENCILTGNKYGIHLKEGRDYTVTGCDFEGNVEGGLYLEDTEDVEIQFNGFKGKIGLHFTRVKNIYVEQNTFTNNADMGFYSFDSEGCEITDNEFTGSLTGIYLEETTDTELTGNRFELCETGVKLEKSEENELKDSVFEDFTTGIQLRLSHYNIVQNCDLSSNVDGFTQGVLVFNSRSNEFRELNIHDMASTTGNVTGMSFTGFSPNNEIISVEMKQFQAYGVVGIHFNASWCYFLDLDFQFLTGGKSAIGIQVLGADNSTFRLLSMTKISARDQAVGVKLMASEKLSIQEANISQVTTDEDSGAGVFFDAVGEDCQLKDSWFKSNDYGVRTVNGSQPQINWNEFTGGNQLAVENLDGEGMVNAENNWWGHRSGPGGSGPGSGQNVGANVDYEPWVGATYKNRKVERVLVGTGTVDARDGADTQVGYEAKDNLTISAFKYDENPGAVFQGDIGKYIDVHVDRGENAEEIEVRLYYTAAEAAGKEEAKLRMSWWNGQEWAVCSMSGVNTADVDDYAGYVWAKLRSDTTPSLDDLGGTPFGANESEDMVVHDIQITVNAVTDEIGPSAQITVSGTILVTPATAVQEVVILLDDVEIGTATLTGSDYSGIVTLPAALSEGTHTVKVQVLLDTLEMNEGSTAIEYVAQTPEVTIAIGMVSELEDGATGNFSLIVTGTLTVTNAGVVETVLVSLDQGTPVEAIVTGNSFTATIPMDGELAGGKHTIVVNATLESGESSEKTKEFDYEAEDDEEEEEEDDDDDGLLTVVGIIVVLVIVVALMAFTGILPVDMFQTGKDEVEPKSLSEEKSVEEPTPVEESGAAEEPTSVEEPGAVEEQPTSEESSAKEPAPVTESSEEMPLREE